MKWCLAALTIITVGVYGCAGPATPETADNGPAVLKLDPMDKPTGAIEVQAFKGGYGTDFYASSAKEFQEKNPGVTTTVDGDPRIWEKLKTRLINNTPPDLMFPGWGMDHWSLATEGALFDLGPALETASLNGMPWKESFNPQILKLGQLNGKQWTLPYYISLNGWWFNPDIFEKNGWSVPANFDELLVLCEKIKANGMIPITYQGKYPYYMLDGLILPWVVSIGGQKALVDMQNLEPGAWESQPLLQAAQMIEQLRDRGFLDPKAVSLTHTESQFDFIRGKVAMIPCGTWLRSEMKAVTPAGTRLEYMLPPVVKGGSGDPTAIQVAIEPWMVPAKAKNPQGAIALFKYMTSLDVAKRFVKAKGTLMSIKGAELGDLPAELQVPAKMYGQSKDVWSIRYRAWYPAFEKEIENAVTALVSKQATAKQFVTRCEAAANAVRNDEEITKYKM